MPADRKQVVTKFDTTSGYTLQQYQEAVQAVWTANGLFWEFIQTNPDNGVANASRILSHYWIFPKDKGAFAVVLAANIPGSAAPAVEKNEPLAIAALDPTTGIVCTLDEHVAGTIAGVTQPLPNLLIQVYCANPLTGLKQAMGQLAIDENSPNGVYYPGIANPSIGYYSAVMFRIVNTPHPGPYDAIGARIKMLASAIKITPLGGDQITVKHNSFEWHNNSSNPTRLGVGKTGTLNFLEWVDEDGDVFRHEGYEMLYEQDAGMLPSGNQTLVKQLMNRQYKINYYDSKAVWVAPMYEIVSDV